MMPLRFLFRSMYWSIRKDWRVAPHLLAVIAGWLGTLIRLRGRDIVAIGLVEHLGDIVAAEPISRLLRRQHPNARIVWFANRPYAAVPARFAAVDATIGVTCLTEWLLLAASGVGNPAVDLHLNRRYCPRCQIPVLKQGAAASIDPDTYYRGRNLLAVECLSAGLPELNDAPHLEPDPAASPRIDWLRLPARFVVLHCASNEPARDWPAANWRALIDGILEDPAWAVVEIGLRPVAIEAPAPRRHDLCGQLSILETAEVIRRASLFVGIDSGPAHVANAVGTRGVILLGHYKGLDDYMPYSGAYQTGENAEIVRANGPISALPLAPVLSAVGRALETV